MTEMRNNVEILTRGGEMRKRSFFLLSFIFFVSVVFFCGCGGSGPGSPGSSGSGDTGVIVDVTNVAHFYLDTDMEWQIDIDPNPDCDGNPTTIDPEPFSDDFAVVDFKGTPLNISPPLPYDLDIETYRVEFFPRDLGLPPIERIDGFASFTIPANGTATGLHLIILDAGRKLQTLDKVISRYGPERPTMQYDMRITLKGKNKVGESFEVEYTTTVLISNYDNCAA
jgi:hypothetical protein